MIRTAEPTTSTPVPPKRRRWKLWLPLFLIVLPALAFIGYTWLTLHFSYSTGERTGYIQKLSKRGWVCKTWEGELAMTTFPGTAPQLFEFSVRDDATARRLLDAAGQKVAIGYQQHKGVPTNCFGETEYFVTDVRTLRP